MEAAAAAVDQSTETAAVTSLQWSLGVWRRQWRWISRQRRRQRPRCSGGGSVDRDGGSGLVAVELTRLGTRAAVDRWTETALLASLQCKINDE